MSEWQAHGRDPGQCMVLDQSNTYSAGEVTLWAHGSSTDAAGAGASMNQDQNLYQRCIHCMSNQAHHTSQASQLQFPEPPTHLALKLRQVAVQRGHDPVKLGILPERHSINVTAYTASMSQQIGV